MDDKKAAKILLGLKDKYALSQEEKAAIAAGVSLLSWASLSQSRIRAMGQARQAKLEKSTKWQ